MLSFIKQFPTILNRNLKIKLIINLFFLILMPFLELVSIGSVGAVVLFVIDLEKYFHLIPEYIVQNYLIDYQKVKILYFFGFLMISVIFLKNIFILYYSYWESTLRRSISAYHSKLLFSSFVNESYLEHTMTSSSDKQNNILNQSSKCSDYIFNSVMLLKEILIAVILLTSLVFINFEATISLFLIGIFISLIFYIFSQKKTKLIGKIAKEKEFDLIDIVKNMFQGFKIIILYGKKNFYEKKFNEIIFFKNKYEVWQQVIQKIPRLIFELVFAAVIVFILVGFINKDEDIKNILPFLIFLSLISIRLLPIFVNINVIISTLKYLEKPVEDLIDVLSKKCKVISFQNKINTKNNYKFENIEKIEIKNLSFTYSNKDSMIIENISFKLKSNEMYALVGKTGAGKSTMLDLIVGMLTPVEGIILANDVDISNNFINWQKNVSYVPQDNFLLDDSILNNICFLDENIDKQRFNKVIEQAELSEFINSLPDKEKTIVGDQGLRISGGQKQRLGLARALYHNKKFLAFDEATSAVDSETEYSIMSTLQKVKKDKIIIIIAHREATINACDAVLNLPSGKISVK